MRVSQTPGAPGDTLQIISQPELIELHLDSGIEQTKLHEEFLCNSGRFGKSQDRRKEVRKIEVEISERMDKLLDGRGFRVGQINLVIHLFAE